MALVFNGYELGAVLLAILIANHVDERRRVDVVRGLQLLARLRRARRRLLLRVESGLRWSCSSSAGSSSSSSRCSWLDLHFFARGREATFRESVIWSLGWLVLGLLA